MKPSLKGPALVEPTAKFFRYQSSHLLYIVGKILSDALLGTLQGLSGAPKHLKVSAFDKGQSHGGTPNGPSEWGWLYEKRLRA